MHSGEIYISTWLHILGGDERQFLAGFERFCR